MTESRVTTHHTITALVEDKPGVLNRIVSMFRRRNYNIASLAVGHSEMPGMSRMTFVVECDFSILHLVTNNLDKLVEVIEVDNISENNSISRELALVKVKFSNDSAKDELMRLVSHIDNTKILSISKNEIILEIIDNEDRIESSVDLLFYNRGPSNVRIEIKEPNKVKVSNDDFYELVEIMRTGVVAMDYELDAKFNKEINN
jgi:acetolactate synthase-1/3 small subunit